jgi:hypothetical protein
VRFWGLIFAFCSLWVDYHKNLDMAGSIVNHSGSSTESVTVQPPPNHSPSSPPDSIEPIASGSNDASTLFGGPRSNAHLPHQPLRYVDSSVSSSGDEIAPIVGQGTSAPLKKTGHGKYAYSDRYDLRDYVIEQLSEYDDIDLVKPWQRKLILVQPIMIVWVLITYSAYYGYRVWCNYQFRLVYGGMTEASWIFICMEGVILCTCSMAVGTFEQSTDILCSTLYGLDDRFIALNR